MRLRSVSSITVCSVFSFVSAVAAQDNPSDAALQQRTEQEITLLLTTQASCWNQKDIEGFMQTYWKSDKLTFSGGGKTTRGWKATLERYKEKYPPEKMGRLAFDQLEISPLSDDTALVLGQWHLRFEDDKADGNFSLVLRKMDGNWKIIHDHSSTLEND